MLPEIKPVYDFCATALVKGTTDDFRQIALPAYDEEDAKARALEFFTNYDKLDVEIVSVEYCDK